MTVVKTPDLNSLTVFVTVAESGGFTAAAQRLGVAKARVSLQISRLEKALGVQLFHRTTRQVSLTRAGESLLAESGPLLNGLQNVLEEAGRKSAELRGVLRISAPVDFAVQTLAPLVSAFARLHPGLQLELCSSDRILDPVREGIDVSFRVGWLQDSTQRAVKLRDFDQYLVAAPSYLARAGKPVTPGQIAGHAWLALTLLRSPLTWTFEAADGTSERVQLQSALRVDSATVLRALLLEGAGLSVMDQPSAQQALDAGRLVRLLKDWSLPRGGIYAVYPPGRYASVKSHAFVDFCRRSLASAPSGGVEAV